MIGYMRELRERGYKLAICTNNVREWEHRWRAMLPVDEIFDVVVDSAFVGTRKPEPRIYELTLEALGVDAGSALLIDDIEANCTGARDLGIHAVWFQSYRAGDRRHRGGAAGGEPAVDVGGRRGGGTPLLLPPSSRRSCSGSSPSPGTREARPAGQRRDAHPAWPTRRMPGDPTVSVSVAGQRGRRADPARGSWASRSSSRRCAPTPDQTRRTSIRCSCSSSATSAPGRRRCCGSAATAPTSPT